MRVEEGKCYDVAGLLTGDSYISEDSDKECTVVVLCVKTAVENKIENKEKEDVQFSSF